MDKDHHPISRWTSEPLSAWGTTILGLLMTVLGVIFVIVVVIQSLSS